MKIKHGIITMAICICAALFLWSDDITAQASDEVVPDNITICGKDVSGMTLSEAEAVVDKYLDKYNDVEFELIAGKNSVKATSKDLALTARNDDIARRALNYGKEGNPLERYKAKKDVENKKAKDFAISLTTTNSVVQSFLEKKSGTLNSKAVNNGLKHTENGFEYIPGEKGTTVLVDKSAVKIADYVSSWDGKNAKIKLAVKTTKPRGTKEELSQVQDVLGSYSTDFSTSSSARAQNVKNGASKIDGSILYPGDTFSVYEAVSPFEAENGYELAGSYENGTTVETYGGGICQVSTTLYNAVMRAELEIVTRSAHSMIVSYVEPSMDAAIAGTAKDFQFKNTTEAPVYLEGYTSGGNIYFTVYGKETRDPNRKVSFVSEVTSQTDPIEEYVFSNELPAGTIQKTQGSHTGYTAKLWKIVTVNGKEVSRDVFNNSRYKVSNSIYTIGTNGLSPEGMADINNAIATQDLGTVKAAVGSWTGEAVAQRQQQQAAEAAAAAAAEEEKQKNEDKKKPSDTENEKPDDGEDLE